MNNKKFFLYILLFNFSIFCNKSSTSNVYNISFNNQNIKYGISIYLLCFLSIIAPQVIDIINKKKRIREQDNIYKKHNIINTE